MKTKHTPGPWIINANLDEDPILTEDGTCPLDFEAVGAELAPNLCLIAAAPDMLEALEYIVKQLEIMPDELDCAEAGMAMRAALEAIRKARGEV